MFNLLSDFGIVDVLFVLNLLQNFKTTKAVNRLTKLQVYASLISDEQLEEIIQVLRSKQ